MLTFCLLGSGRSMICMSCHRGPCRADVREAHGLLAARAIADINKNCLGASRVAPFQKSIVKSNGMRGIYYLKIV